MLLSDNEIYTLVRDKGLIEPYSAEQLQPCSYDVRLDRGWKTIIPSGHAAGSWSNYIDASEKKLFNLEYLDEYEDVHILPAGAFALASTIETVNIPNNIAARFEGKSSLGRIGLTTHVTAGFIDAGFSGQITLEIKNETSWPMVLRSGMKIGQLCFFKLTSESSRPYGSDGLGSHYQNQLGVTAARN